MAKKYKTQEEAIEARKLYYKQYREKNKEIIKQKNKEAAKRDREKINARRRKYYQTDIGRQKINYGVNKRRAERLQQYREYMKDKKCNRCDCNDQRVLVWHHKDPSTKIRTVYHMVNLGISWNTVLKEIDKCECLCQNCHIIEHSPITSRVGVRQKYKEFMETQKCNRCNYNIGRALEWHHKDITVDDNIPIARMLSNQYSWTKILAEMSKCECLCRNCHHIETHYSGINYCHRH